MSSDLEDLFGGEQAPPAPTAARTGKLVLVVDDSEMMRMTISRIIEKFGHRVIEAADGNQALDACRHNAPDLVFLDWVMPERNGLETLREMRRIPKLRETPVVLLTVVRDKDTIREAGRYGVQDYVSKPAKPGRVVEKVHKYLGS